jgi:diguanylate cyclase (GGDEF)-like protein
VRLIDRSDTSLVLALVASSLVVFHQPLRIVFDAAHAAEVKYGLDLLPGLTVLVGTFGFHEFRKRQAARDAALAATAEAEAARLRAAELERLVAFGRALGSALEPVAMRQVFWRYMPVFAGERELWMLTRTRDAWDLVVRDATRTSERGVDALQALAEDVLARPDALADTGLGLRADRDVCFPMIVGDAVIGVVGVRDEPPLAPQEARGLAAAAAVLAISIRNGQLLAQTRESSVRDSLTGCFNRAFAMDALKAELQRARRSGRGVSAMMIDIDGFKSVNDRYGHLAGDAILSAIGAQLATALRNTDVKCRYGGDEFLIILPDTNLAGAERAAAVVVDQVGRIHVDAHGSAVTPTVSVGVTAALDGEHEPATVIARADQALYEAKRSGRNRAVAARLAPAS